MIRNDIIANRFTKRTKNIVRTVALCLTLCLLLSMLVACASDTPYIGENGNWWVGDTDLGVCATGEKGDTGAQGEKGDQGEQGEQGETGAQGEKGDQGEQGETGAKGAKGDKGDTGAQGKTGASAYELFCQQYNYTGTLDEWLETYFVPKTEYTAAEIYEASINAVVTIINYDDTGTATGCGSGFFIDDKGTLVTAYHVIDNAYSMDVITAGGGRFSVKQVIGFDVSRDLAILKITGLAAHTYLELETEERLPGTNVYALGSSLGFLDGTFSSGIISAKPRSETIDESRGIDMQYIQFTAPVSPGNSGGPLIDGNGKVVGVVDACYTDGNSLNLAVHINELQYVSQNYKKSVKEFYEDTVFFKMRCLDTVIDESEDNNTKESADLLKNGETAEGSASDTDDDYYQITIGGTETVKLFLYVYFEDGNGYGPVIYSATQEDWLDVGWDDSPIQYTSLGDGYYVLFDIAPGTYYVCVTGSEAEASDYLLFAYYGLESDVIIPIEVEDFCR